MAVLKDHMLHDIAITLCSRLCDDPSLSERMEKFVQAGRGPLRAFGRIIESDITVTSVGQNYIVVNYQGCPWKLESVFLNTLFAKWARKLRMEQFGWLCLHSRRGYSKILSENNGIEELRIDDDKFYDWSAILKAFPKITILGVTARNFTAMLLSQPKKLMFLKEIELADSECEKGSYFRAAHETLSKHQSKCPNLETIRYVDAPLRHFRKFKANIPTIKHIEVNTEIRCCNCTEFAFLTAAQKMFSSLKSVDFIADVSFHCYCNQDKARKLEVIEKFYQAFESLKFGFLINIVYHETLTFKKDAVDELYQFFCTKGIVSGEPLNFTAKTSFPGKDLIYKMDINPVT